MKNYFVAILVSLSLLGLSACNFVTSAQHGNTSLTGEAWYVQETIFGLTWATKVYWCPAPTGKGPVQCIQAIMHEEGEVAAGGGFGAPAQPAQPAYGAPAQPAQPAQPGYGAPAQPGYGQPAQPAGGGYQPQPAPEPQPVPAPAPPPPGY